MKLKLETRMKDGILVVNCSGRIVFGEESSLLRDTVRKAVSENNRIVLNLGDGNYIDSGGRGTLVDLLTTAQHAGGTIKLMSLTKRVGDLLQLTKLLTVFDVAQENLTSLLAPVTLVSTGYLSLSDRRLRMTL